MIQGCSTRFGSTYNKKIGFLILGKVHWLFQLFEIWPVISISTFYAHNLYSSPLLLFLSLPLTIPLYIASRYVLTALKCPLKIKCAFLTIDIAPKKSQNFNFSIPLA